jgi:hypothetical protein
MENGLDALATFWDLRSLPQLAPPKGIGDGASRPRTEWFCTFARLRNKGVRNRFSHAILTFRALQTIPTTSSPRIPASRSRWGGLILDLENASCGAVGCSVDECPVAGSRTGAEVALACRHAFPSRSLERWQDQHPGGGERRRSARREPVRMNEAARHRFYRRDFGKADSC